MVKKHFLKTIPLSFVSFIFFCFLCLSAHTQEASTVKYSETDKKRILDKANHPSYEADLKKVEELNAMYCDNKSSNFHSWQSVELMHPNKDTLTRISKTFEEYWKVYYDEKGLKENFQQKVLEALDCLEGFERRLLKDYCLRDEYYYKVIPDAKAGMTNAVDLASKKYEVFAKEKFTTHVFADDYRFRWTDVDQLLNDVRYKLAVIKLENGKKMSELPDLQQKLDAAIAQIEPYKVQFLAKVKELEAKEKENELKALEAVRAPKEQYNGPDKEQLRKKIFAENNSCAKYKLAKVIFTEKNWERESGSKYKERSERFEDYDNSYLAVNVIIYDRSHPEVGYIIDNLAVERDNRNKSYNYELTKTSICPEDLEGGYYEVKKILMKNVK